MWRFAPHDSILILARGLDRGPRRDLGDIGVPARTLQLRFGLLRIKRGPVAGHQKHQSRNREYPDRG